MNFDLCKGGVFFCADVLRVRDGLIGVCIVGER